MTDVYSSQSVVAPRSRKRGVEKFVRISVAVLALIIATEISFHLFISPHLRVRKIIISGDRPASDEHLIELTGINARTHYGEVKPTQIEARIASHPAILDVSVAKRFPNTVVVDIQERQPVGIVFRALGDVSQMYYFDRDGAVFTTARALSSQSLPVLSGVSQSEWGIGTAFPLQLQELLKSVAVLRDTEPEVYNQISEIVALPLEGGYYEALVYFIGTPIRVRVSSAIKTYQFKQIMAALDLLRQRRALSQVSEIDFRSGEAVLSLQ